MFSLNLRQGIWLGNMQHKFGSIVKEIKEFIDMTIVVICRVAILVNLYDRESSSAACIFDIRSAHSSPLFRETHSNLSANSSAVRRSTS
jgi:hypothetical protein